jgi:hypothetical protein
MKRDRHAEVNDINFVRKNLRNRKGLGKKRHKIETKGPNSSSTCGTIENTGSKGVKVSHGLASLGLDPLQMSLDAITTVHCGRSNSMTNNLSNYSAKDKGSPTKLVARGLVDPSKLLGKSVRRFLKESGEIPDEVLAQYAPACPSHRIPATLLRVKKTGANKGRKFYGCSCAEDQRCDFFMWAEDSPSLLMNQVGKKVSIFWDENAISIFRYKISQLTITELKLIIRNVNARFGIMNISRRLTLGGTREEVFEKVMIEERELLYANMHLIGLRNALPLSKPLTTEKISTCHSNDEEISLGDSADELSLEDSDDSDLDDIPVEHMSPHQQNLMIYWL